MNVSRYLKKYMQRSYYLMDENQKVFQLMYPMCFGGIPVLPYLRCLTKVDSDLETIWFSLWKFLSKLPG